MTTLADLADTARHAGWAADSVSLPTLRWNASQLGWVEIATRKGESTVAVMRPTSAARAHPRSLSATYGLDEQPLHTDGAHIVEPPDFILLHSIQPSSTATLLWSESSKLTYSEHPNVSRPGFLRSGLFVVRSGNDRFLAPAYKYSQGYRYDPGCMSPCDERARSAVKYFDSLQGAAHRHEWQGSDEVLLINNRTSLHARAAVDRSDTDREITRIAYRAGPKR